MPTYFEVFTHWNVNGNRIVAAALQRLLKQEDLLSPPTSAPAP